MRRALLLLPTMIGCHDPDSTSSEVCPRPTAAFDVRLTAEGGEIRPGTRLSVTYGGAVTEMYELGQSQVGQEILCCVEGDGAGRSLDPADCGAVLSPDASALALDGQTRLVRCAIWTNGAADVFVESAGYLPLEETLVARTDEEYPDCATWDTVEVELQLTYPEAGAPRH